MQTDKQTHRKTGRHIHIDRQTHADIKHIYARPERHRQTEIERERKKEIDRHTVTHRHKHTHTENDRHIAKETQTGRTTEG